MWLINTETYRLHCFIGDGIPKYGILSHRWEDEELSFTSYRDARLVNDLWSDEMEQEEQLFPSLRDLRLHRTGRLKGKKGWRKVEQLCKLCRIHELDWAWLDTVCIDKSSSAELQEAINSMYKWYLHARRCFVYMNDVDGRQHPRDSRAWNEHFRSSLWFTRAWTLQELLAPSLKHMKILDKNWRKIGWGDEMVEEIASATTIAVDVFTHESKESKIKDIRSRTIAQRMSWAAKRQASRPEDIAYSLLGLFDVNLTMLYGEGLESAFKRLQLEIMKESADETILAWSSHEGCRKNLSALAQLPACFESSARYVSLPLPFGNHTFSRGISPSPAGLMVTGTFLEEQDPYSLKTHVLMPICLEEDERGGRIKIVCLKVNHIIGDEHNRSRWLQRKTMTAAAYLEYMRETPPKRICIRWNASH